MEVEWYEWEYCMFFYKVWNVLLYDVGWLRRIRLCSFLRICLEFVDLVRFLLVNVKSVRGFEVLGCFYVLKL